MDLSSVSYADLKAELDRRLSIQNGKLNSDDVMDIIEPPTKVNQQAVADLKEQERQEEIERLRAELEFKEMQKKVLEHQLSVERDMERMREEHEALGEQCRTFMSECHRRNQATMTTERLSLFNW